MSSQSSRSPAPRWIYDVFLSFRGDTRESCASGLYEYLRTAGIYVYAGDLGLQIGENISPLLLQAIQASRISIIVFSKNYASSVWCLDEAKEMMECRRTMGQVVVPVFYVDPSDVRHQRGPFEAPFLKHMARFRDEVKVNAWRSALTEAADLSGYDMHNSRSEIEGIKNVVEGVTSLLDLTDLFIAEHPVGVQSRAQDVIQLLNCQNSKDVLLLGIWGMGGSGATTIAKAVYNQISRTFEGRKFLPNIRQMWENDPVFVQLRLLNGICKTTEIKINSIESGMVKLKEELHGKRVFLVLDDVNKSDQLKALCGSRDWFGPGSRIIITTRDKHLLSMLEVDHIYPMKEMDYNESVELFSWYAFKKATPPKDFVGLREKIVELFSWFAFKKATPPKDFVGLREKIVELFSWFSFKKATPPKDFAGISKKFVSYCGGLPLALVAIGHELFGKKTEEWESVLDGLKRCPHPEVQKVLKISFDGLRDDREKEIFLDIASFWIGMDKNDVTQTLNHDFGQHSTEVGINVLEEKSLITIDEKNKLQMHPLLRDMGREITREISQTGPQQGVYDIFLSFRGKDTRSTFTSHLHTSLENAGIYVFKDDGELPRGERISISLLKAIGHSKMSVIVLSTNYADSRSCLLELENIMACHRTKGQMVVPVFYKVDPSDVRKQTGEFGKGFEKLIKEISVEEDKVLSWRMVLREVGGLSGIVVVNSRDESADIKKVIQDVTRLLDETELFVATHPVGLTSRVKDLIEKLKNQQSKDVILFGIWAMGGMGKTTIAKAIYNQIGRNFEGRSFLLNIREVWEQVNGPVILQQRVLDDIYKTTKMQIHDVESGKKKLEKRLAQKRVFLVLDDVNILDQLNALCGSRKWFGQGSAIIITTRDKHLLYGVDCTCVIEQLNEIESLELFSRHAFKESSPKKDFVGLSKEVVSYCQGLPLALEVLGSYLFDRETEMWKDTLEKLKTIPKKEVQDKLRISFDGCEDTEKEIFLDIAFFFIGMDRNDVVQILNGCGLYAGIGISVLVQRSLVTVDNNNKLGMHDLLQAMGREIVRKISPEPEERSRLWYYEEVRYVLENNTGTKAIKGLTLKLPTTDPITLYTEAFMEMRKLKLLQLAGVEPKGDFRHFSNELRWMNWHGFPLRHIPTDYYQRSLVSFELEHSNLNLVWKEAEKLEKLKILNLSYSHNLSRTPDFSYLHNLEKLVLKYCTSLTSISHTIGQLEQILLINLEGCTSLSNLPRSIYELKSLNTLILSGCLMIDKLEEDIEKMESLTTLKADNTGVTQVPYALARMKSIGYISMCGFEGPARDVIPSIIWSWTSPTNKLSSLMQTSLGMSSIASLDVPNLRAKCGSQLQITGDHGALDTFSVKNYEELEARPTTSQVSNMGTFALMIDKLEEDLERMESLTILKAEKTGMTQVPNAIAGLKSLGYISWGGYEGLARDVIPYIIWSWTSPTNKPSSLMQTSLGMLSSDSIDVPHLNLRPKRGCSQLQITTDHGKELEARATTSQVSNINTSALIVRRMEGDIPGSKSSFNSFLIQMGMNSPITEILKRSILQELRNCGPGDCLLPGDNNPHWFTFSGEGSIVTFEVPRVAGRNLKTMMLCIVYSSSQDIVTSEDLILKNVLIINYTKSTTHMYEGDKLASLKDEDWQSTISNLEPGDEVNVVVVIYGDGFIVKKTAAYLVVSGGGGDVEENKKRYFSGADDDMPSDDENDTIFGGDDKNA